MQDWQRLIEAYLAGNLSGDEMRTLEQTLLTDPDRMDEFANELLMHDDLFSVSETLPATPMVELPQDRGSAITKQEVEDGVGNVHRRKASTTSTAPIRYWGLVFLAASVLIVALTGILLLSVASPDEPVVSQTNTDVSPDPASIARPTKQDDSRGKLSRPRSRVAAYLGRTIDCVWTDSKLSEGSQVQVGTKVALQQGVAEFIFNSGARVKAQGPCAFVVNDPEAFTLLVGDVTVRAAFGFKVFTPSGTVIDLGTEFGVSVDDQGGSEVHVFEGEVAFQARTNSEQPEDKSVVLKADRACRYALGGITLHEFEANEAKFDWSTLRPLEDSQVPALGMRDGLTLWLAADRFVETDDRGHVERWRDLVVEGNSTAEDALQLAPRHRPMLVERGINGRPVVRFDDGGTFLITPPIRTTDEHTAFVACSLNDVDPSFQQIINYNGPPQRVVGPFRGFVSPAVFEICLRDRNGDGHFAVCGEVFSGYREKDRQQVVKKVAEATDYASVGEPMVVCFRYSLQRKHMSLHLNGIQMDKQMATWPIAITSRKIIGRHPVLDSGKGIFQGDIGEILLYNRYLTDTDVEYVSNYLCDRFGVVQLD